MEPIHPDKPLIALTLGDVAGIGPEVVARACQSDAVRQTCVPLVVGHPSVLQRAIELVKANLRVQPVDNVASLNSTTVADDVSSVLCWNPVCHSDLDFADGKVDARCGQAAHDYLVAAVHSALEGKIAGIVTAPLNKEGLRQAGINFPGHTEILADVCGVDRFAMMLYLPPGEPVQGRHGLGIAHVTLHTSVRSVPDLLSEAAVYEKVLLLQNFLQDVGCEQPRIGVTALNPHAGEHGLFGDEESQIIEPAVLRAKKENILAQGPFPADTLICRAVAGEFDGIVAMYHDQGHIALKLIGWNRAINITLGIPIVRTSPSHGTAYDIAWQGKANGAGMIDAVILAARLSRNKFTTSLQNGCNEK